MKQIEYKLQNDSSKSNHINIILNVNRLKTTIKRQRLSDLIFLKLKTNYKLSTRDTYILNIKSQID